MSSDIIFEIGTWKLEIRENGRATAIAVPGRDQIFPNGKPGTSGSTEQILHLYVSLSRKNNPLLYSYVHRA